MVSSELIEAGPGLVHGMAAEAATRDERDATVLAVDDAIRSHAQWQERFGETSYDHQSFFAGPFGGRAKALYYRAPVIGTLAVAPMILAEALLPAARVLFWKKQRFPIADAHYAMAFAMLARRTGEQRQLERARHFLGVLEQTRCPGYERHAWGYPFDWVTRTGVMAAGTPLITTTPYVYEAFEQVFRLDGDLRWREVMRSIAEHALLDFPDRVLSGESATVGYNPVDAVGGVVNASAYRAFLLYSAGLEFDRDDYLAAARRNLNFVLGAQQEDGSWRYAEDGERHFVDHFHTCFVLKALAKLEGLGAGVVSGSIDRGVKFYVHRLFDDELLPKPFAQAPRLTVYRRELYDYAECINLGVLLKGRDPDLDRRVQATLDDLLRRWTKPDGSFRSRELRFGWDKVPMHRWAQAQAFRSLCFAALSSSR